MKSYVALAVLAALCLGAANQANGAAVSYDDIYNPGNSIDFGIAMRMFLNAFQRVMPCGYAPYNLPVLAPFTLDYIDIDMSDDYYSLLGNVSDLVVTGMNNFRIIGGTYNATTNRATFDVIFPEMQLLGEYALNAMAILAGYRSEMAGSGLLNVKFIDFRWVGEYTLGPSPQNPNGLAITDANMNFYFGDVIFNNWNTMWNISLNNFVNKFAREFMLMWTQQIQVQVDAYYAELVLPSVNSILDEVSMTNLVDFLVSQAADLTSANCPSA